MNWIRPSFRDELGEFKRISSHFNISIVTLWFRFVCGHRTELSDEIWSRLHNTDSWETQTTEYADHAARQNNRDIVSLRQAFRDQKPMQMPVVIQRGEEYHLVSGNTRLMVCRSQSIRPQILLI